MSGKLKEVRERIQSVISTQQITKAMKMVSAAKLRKSQTAIVQMRPYANRLENILLHIITDLHGNAESPFAEEREPNRVMMVVITSNRGLCGAFNSNIIKKTVAAIEKYYQDVREAGRLSILCIGKRGYDYFRKRYTDCEIIADFVDLFKDLSFDHVKEASAYIMDRFEAEELDHIYVSYGRFKNAGVQYPELVRFLPVERMKPEFIGKKVRMADYIFEPGRESLLQHLIPSILQATFHKYILDTHASEHGARMTAMDKATENANELLKDLRINYNKARQEAITRELSEIVGGAAALES